VRIHSYVGMIPRNLPVSDTSCPAVCGTALVSRRHKNHNTRQRVIYPEQTQGQEEREFDLDRGPLTLAEVKTRFIQEGDSTQTCVICREEFRLKSQVTSCDLVPLKSCPMCRKEQYETRCAVRIQAFWRGYLVRKWHSNMKYFAWLCLTETHFHVTCFLNQFQEMNDSLVGSCSTDVKWRIRTGWKLKRRFAIMPLLLHLHMQTETEIPAVQRGVQDCLICLNHLGSNNSLSKEDRNVLLLSCSHLFHEPCLQAFELFCHEVNPTPSLPVIIC
uniref:Ring finger protein 32 n=1 Tax=Cyprinus carpio carpio TaxID=630221 RepID=A0A9J7YXH4_CYPCA